MKKLIILYVKVFELVCKNKKLENTNLSRFNQKNIIVS